MVERLRKPRAAKTFYSVMTSRNTVKARRHATTLISVDDKAFALSQARLYKKEHPGSLAGVFKVTRVKVFGLRKQRKHHK